MRPISVALLLAVLALFGSSRESVAQTIFVEDFETPDTANYLTILAGQFLVTATHTWAVTLNSVDLYEAPQRPEAAAYDGSQAVDLTGSPGAGVMETSFATVPGAGYELVFYYARNNYLGAEVGQAQIEVVGSSVVLIDSVYHDSAQYLFSDYQPYMNTFTADSTESTLRFTALNEGIAGITIDAIEITTVGPTAVGSNAPRVTDGIVAAYPNPFNPAVTIDYVTAEPGFVEANIHDIHGRLVRTLVGAVKSAGAHSMQWAGVDENGSGVASGIYFVVLTTPSGTSSQKLVLLK